MVELLSLYRDIYTDLDDSHELREQYEDNRLVLIIDGIDELGSSTMELLRHLLLRQILSGTLMQRTFLF